MKGMRFGRLLAMMILLMSVVGCVSKGVVSPVEGEVFGRGPGGTQVEIFTLTNKNGMEVMITNYGGIVVSLKVPDRNGRLDDVVLGYDSIDDYTKNNPYFGCIVGRYGNRIGGGKFTLQGKEYKLATNNGPNHLHGGEQGFDKVTWKATPKETFEGPALALHYISPDGEEGYPGRLDCTVVYTVTHENELRIEYVAATDQDTIVNLTHHSYFNLAGAGSGDILDHVVTIYADHFTPVDEGLIPTGEIHPVRGTPFDFTQPIKIGARINQSNQQLKYGQGYDHNWVLRNQGGSLSPAAKVVEETTGRVMEVYTTEPGMQFYTGNFLDGSHIGKGGKPYKRRYGFCMETQHYPDSPNRPNFPSVVLKAGERYETRTVYKFSAR